MTARDPPTKDFIEAPWLPEEVDALNTWQRSALMHPFTCKDSHGSADRTLLATRHGWICPHCDYTQNWAHRAMLITRPLDAKLSCDVILPPALIIRKGVDLSILMTALRLRHGRPPEQCRFNDPVRLQQLVDTVTDRELDP